MGVTTIIHAIFNFFNDLIHIELIAILVDCVFWLVIFVVGFPIAAIVALLRMLYQLGDYFFGSKDIDPKVNANDEELAVFITGCDSGFGRRLVAPLTERGFTVFCGCLQKKSFHIYHNNPLAIPLQLDVTSDKSVADAGHKISAWLNAKNTKTTRHLHALVNNAGIARLGPIDWAPLSDFEACMEVNFFGLIRVTKEILPIFKKQKQLGMYQNARIVNVTSMAGQFLGGDHMMTPYSTSKFAADSFTTNLRLEMEAWNVQVSCINPTFHTTPMADKNNVDVTVEGLWNGMSKQQQDEYGPDFKEEFRENLDRIKYICWRSQNVVNAMEECVVSQTAPRRLLVGLDAKYGFAPLNLLSAGIGPAAIQTKPAAMNKRK